MHWPYPAGNDDITTLGKSRDKQYTKFEGMRIVIHWTDLVNDDDVTNTRSCDL